MSVGREWRFFYGGLYRRALISCCAVARAQHFGKDSRSSRPEAGYVQTHDFLRATIFAAGEDFCCASFVRRRRDEKLKRRFILIRRRQNNLFTPLFLFAVVEENIQAPFANSSLRFILFLAIFLFAVVNPKVKGAFRHLPQLLFRYVLVFAVS